MILPNDYDSTKTYTGQGSLTPLPIGGHICRIVGARAGKFSTGNDMIEVAFDIAEGGEFDGRFKQKFDLDRASRADAKWPNGGMFRAGILNRSGRTNSFFKGLITSIEESNAGYSFKGSGCDESTLKGKMVGFNFGEEEYMSNSGEIRTAVKPFYAVSVATVREGIEPPRKKEYRPKPDDMAARGFADVTAEAMPELPF